MKKFMFAQRFMVSDFTQLSDMPWISNQSFVIEADTLKNAWGKAVELYGKKYNLEMWKCREIDSNELFFQNSWVKFFLKANRGVNY